MTVLGQRDQPPGAGVEPDRRRSGEAGAADRRAHQRAVAGGRPHRRRGQADHGDRRADQPAGAQRHDRGGARRRGRPRLRGGGLRGEGAGGADRQGDRGDPAPDRRHADRDRRSRSPPSRRSAARSGASPRSPPTIAAAVEEQGAATQEIARNVRRGRARAPRRSPATSPTSTAAPAKPARLRRRSFARRSRCRSESSQLKLEVDKFLSTVRAA